MPQLSSIRWHRALEAENFVLHKILRSNKRLIDCHPRHKSWKSFVLSSPSTTWQQSHRLKHLSSWMRGPSRISSPRCFNISNITHSPGCTKWSLQVVMMARVAAWLKIEIARWKGQERFRSPKECITRVPRARFTSSPPHGLLPIQLSCDRQIEVSFLITLLFPLCHLCTIDVMNKPIMNVNPIYPEGIWMFCPNPPISQWESHCYCNIVATRKKHNRGSIIMSGCWTF